MIFEYCELNGVDNNYKSFKNIIGLVMYGYNILHDLHVTTTTENICLGLNRNIAEMSG